MIRLTHDQDIAFSHIAQNSKVTGAILPSGLQVPKQGDWKIKGTSVVLMKNKCTNQNITKNKSIKHVDGPN